MLLIVFTLKFYKSHLYGVWKICIKFLFRIKNNIEFIDILYTEDF